MSKREIPHVETLRDHDGDWSILRINGKTINESHSLRIDLLLDWLEKNGHIKIEEYTLENREINYGSIDYDNCPLWVCSAYDDHVGNLDFEEGL